MSAASSYERDPLDFFITPDSVTRAILPFLPRGAVLDPSCGDGAILRVVSAAWPQYTHCGFDIVRRWDDARQLDMRVRDAFDEEPWPDVDLVIGNPPYDGDAGGAEDFARRALEELAPQHGTIALNLRLGFLASRQRLMLHRHYPSDVYVIAERPDYATEKGVQKGNRYDMAWFVWGPGRGGRLFHLSTEGR